MSGSLALIDIFACAGVLYYTVPVKTVSEIVDMALGIHVAFHVEGYVFVLKFHRRHVRRHLDGEKCGRFRFARNDLHNGLFAYVETKQYGIYLLLEY